MKLTATPFNTETGELLPVYRDAYLRGDLSRSSAKAVEEYLRRDADEVYSVVSSWHRLQADENPPAAPSWAGKQLQFIREQPPRFRRCALSLGTAGALLAGAAMAANHLSATSLPATSLSAAAIASTAPTVVAPTALEAHTVVVHGRILNEKGLPLAGATVLQKGTRYGTSTYANGNYSLRVPADSHTMLQYGYGGYTEQEVKATTAVAILITLQPKEVKRKHWLFF